MRSPCDVQGNGQPFTEYLVLLLTSSRAILFHRIITRCSYSHCNYSASNPTCSAHISQATYPFSCLELWLKEILRIRFRSAQYSHRSHPQACHQAYSSPNAAMWTVQYFLARKSVRWLHAGMQWLCNLVTFVCEIDPWSLNWRPTIRSDSAGLTLACAVCVRSRSCTVGTRCCLIDHGGGLSR